MFDTDGYPTEKALDTLHEMDLFDFKAVAEMMIELWYYPDRIKLYKYKGKYRLKASTGGWSGNEVVIEALPEHFDSMYILEYKRGGLYLWESRRPA